MVDWQRLALNLRRHKPLCALSREMGKNPGYLGQLLRGEIKEPRFYDGLRLLDLHLDWCGEDSQRRLLGKILIK